MSLLNGVEVIYTCYFCLCPSLMIFTYPRLLKDWFCLILILQAMPPKFVFFLGTFFIKNILHGISSLSKLIFFFFSHRSDIIQHLQSSWNTKYNWCLLFYICNLWRWHNCTFHLQNILIAFRLTHNVFCIDYWEKGEIFLRNLSKSTFLKMLKV